MKVAFLGLGVMGYPMAGHLVKKGGHSVTVFNRTRAKADAWAKEYGGSAAGSPAEAAKGAQIVFMCVGDDPDVRAVGTAAFAGMEKGTILVDHTTASAVVAREMDEAARAKGLRFLDAPVSGGEAGAKNGVLTVMCGGDPKTFDEAKSAMESYGRAVTLLGPSGSGQLTKMVNQICIAGCVQGLAEGLAFGMKAGLDVAKVIDVISKGAAQSWQMENRGKTMIEDKFEFGFAVNWMRKDLRVSLDEARRNGAKLPVAALVDQFYAEIQRRGGGRYDTSSLMKLVQP
ncbi:MAG TPA: NAD(P)-dependent oxidoreductase [Candidatus Sulfotelmatobacter sp.]|nr:NAD(P)-dependent oxidoreductase [Candidatus Sulfotelmatobacter sp.]